MTPRDLVRRTLEFRTPPSVPRQTWILPWAEEHYPREVAHLRARFPDDVVSAPALYRAPLPITGNRYVKGTYVDEWGCRFDNIHGGVIGLVREPLVRTWDDLGSFRTPAAAADLDADQIDAFCRGTDQFVLSGAVVRPFERLCFLRTMEQALIDLAEQPPELFELVERIHQQYLREVEAWSATAVDAIALMDDWGSQTAMLAAPAVFRRLFKRCYREYAEIARRRSKFVFMHSDGNILEIVGDLIEAGVDALNSQIKCMGAAELGRRFRGRVTFWGEIDRQELLPRGTLDQIREAVRELRDHLWANGGVIAQCEFGPGARPANVMAVFETWQTLGPPAPGALASPTP